MKALFLFLLTAGTCYAQTHGFTEKTNEYLNSLGEKITVVSTVDKNGFLEGSMTMFVNGKKFLVASFEKGIRNGYEIYYKDGVEKYRIHFENGVVHGVNEKYSEDTVQADFFYYGKGVTKEEFFEKTN